MKNFLRGGRELPQRLIEDSLINRLLRSEAPRKDGRIVRHIAHSLRPKAFLIIFCVLFSSHLVSPASGQEATGLNNVQPLMIGDTIPEELWDMPLAIVNHPDQRKSITLREFQDSDLIVLDFWATYCKPCIQSVNKLLVIQSELSEHDITVLPVLVYDDGHRVLSLMKDNNWTVPSVVKDTVLNKQAFYNYLTGFGVVWIQDNKLLAVPEAKAVTLENVLKAINREPLAIKNRLGYPLLSREREVL